MQSKKASKRYAKALFIAAKDKKKEKEVFLDCNHILNLLNRELKLIHLIKNPTVKKTIKISVLKKIFITNLSKTTMDFLILVIQKGREIMIKDIIMNYRALYNIENNIIDAEIISSRPMSETLKESIKHRISPNRDVRLTEKIDNDLL